jgi:hypothetical protein
VGTRAKDALLSGHLRVWLVAIAVLAVAAIGGPILANELSSHSQQNQLDAPALTSPQRYEASGLPFVAEFPSAPSVGHVHLALVRAPYTATIYTADSGSSAVTVGVYPFPLGKLGRFSAGTFIHTVISHGALASRPTLRERGATEIQGLPAAFLASTHDGGALADFGVMVLDGHVAYEILVSGPATTVDTTFQHVMSTFRIVDPADGMVRY